MDRIVSHVSVVVGPWREFSRSLSECFWRLVNCESDEDVSTAGIVADDLAEGGCTWTAWAPAGLRVGEGHTLSRSEARERVEAALRAHVAAQDAATPRAP